MINYEMVWRKFGEFLEDVFDGLDGLDDLENGVEDILKDGSKIIRNGLHIGLQ